MPRLFETRDVSAKDTLQVVVVVHALTGILSGMILDGGEISIPGALYSGAVILYASVRFTTERVSTGSWPKVPWLTHVAWVLLPLYAAPLFFVFFYLGMKTRYGWTPFG